MPTASPREVGTGPRNQRKRPGDLTGTQGQKLAQERDEAQAQALAEAAAAKVEDRTTALNTVVDYTKGGRPPAEVEEVDTPLEPQPTSVRIRVNYPIEDMTFGREVISPAEFDEEGRLTKAPVLGGLNTYDFEEGVQYDVSPDLARHLKSLGYVYDF
jgi:hypothetical protein